MKLIHYKDPVAFREAVLETLLTNEAENNLPLGILANVISGDYREHDPYLALVEKDGTPLISVMCTPPFPVLLSYEDPLPDDAILKLVLTDLLEVLEKKFVGFTGNKKLASRLKDLWQEMTGEKALLNMAMRIYKLEHVNSVFGVPGNIRPAGEKDKTLMLDWYANFHRDGMLEEPDPTRVQKQVRMYLEADPRERGLMIWEEDGEPVSMAGYAGPTPHGIRVGAVYTPPEYRKQGYASACTAGLSEHLLGLGYQFCFLFTDLLNPTSNHIYQQIGYEAVCDVDRYDFK